MVSCMNFRPSQDFIGIDGDTYSIKEFNTSSVYSIPQNKERNVSYSIASIVYPNNGKETFIFEDYTEEPNKKFEWSEQTNLVSNNFAFRDNSNQRGLLKRKETFDESNNLLRREEYKYSEHTDSIPELRGMRINYTIDPAIMDAYAYTIPNPRKRIGVVETDFLYDDASYVTKIDSSFFGEFHTYVLPIKTSQENSGGRLHYTTYDYLNSYPDDDLRQMLFNDNSWQPWRVRDYVNEGNVTELVGGYKNEFATYSLADGSLITPPNVTQQIHLNKKYHYEATWIGGVYSIDTALQYTVFNYDYVVPIIYTGLATEVNMHGWADNHLYTWSPSGKLLEDKFDSYVKQYEYYDENDMMKKDINIDGISLSYTYDDFQRLKTVTHDQKEWVRTMDYYFGTSANELNYIQDSTYYPLLGNNPGSIVNRIIYDGSNREVQNLKMGQSPEIIGGHIVNKTIEYDEIGRPFKSFEPWSTNGSSGNFQDPAGQLEFLLNSYEASPLNRIESMTPPSWHATNYIRRANGVNEVFNHHTNTYFPANSLFVTRIQDPNGNYESFITDLRGNEVLKRQDPPSGIGDETYTIWDKKDRKSIVLPPGVDISNSNLQFFYEYYGNDKLSFRNVPDAAPVSYLYNERDFLAYLQDGNMVSDNRVLGIQYDKYGNITKEGWFNNVPTETNGFFAQAQINSTLKITNYGTSGTALGKPENVFHRFFINLNGSFQTFYQYDNCGRPIDWSNTFYRNSIAQTINSRTPTYDSRDVIIKELHTFTDGNGDQHDLIRHYDFDVSGRQIQESIQKENSGVILPLVTKSYTSKEQLATKEFISSGNVSSLSYEYLPNRFLSRITEANQLYTHELYYDDTFDSNAIARSNGDVSTQRWKIKGRNFEHYNYNYDFKNQIIDADYFSTGNTGAFDVDYVYDQRGNFQSITRAGSISAKSKGLAVDDLEFTFIPNSNRIQQIIDHGDETKGFKNKSKKNAANLSYDNNGNVISDSSRGITMTMNHLNKPDRIEISSTDYVDYYYDADGVLHRKEIYENNNLIETRDYVRDVELVNGEIAIIHFSEGFLTLRNGGELCNGSLNLVDDEDVDQLYYCDIITSDADVMNTSDVSYLAEECVILNSGFEVLPDNEFLADILPNNHLGQFDWNVFYVMRDHLGNTKMVFSDINEDGAIEDSEITQISTYYPFGGEHSNIESGDYAYRYNGKEKELAHGIGLLEYGARQHDPWTGRFMGVDPLSDDFNFINTYNYAENSPIANIDFWGLQAVSAIQPFIFEDGTESINAILETFVITAERPHPKGTGLSVSPFATKSTYTDPIVNVAFVGIGGALISSSTLLAPFGRFGFLTETIASTATGGEFDIFDASAGFGGGIFYAATTPIFDISPKGEVSTFLNGSKSGLLTSVEFGANILGLFSGRLGSSFLTKSLTLQSQSRQLINISTQVPQLSINSHLSSQAMMTIANNMAARSYSLGNLGHFFLVSESAEDILSKMIIKSNSSN